MLGDSLTSFPGKLQVRREEKAKSVRHLTTPKTLVSFRVIPGLRITDLRAKDCPSA